LEEVDVGKFLHFLDIVGFDNFLVVEEDPRWRTLAFEKLADECNVVTRRPY
jgi:hypothetical protein